MGLFHRKKKKDLENDPEYHYNQALKLKAQGGNWHPEMQKAAQLGHTQAQLEASLNTVKNSWWMDNPYAVDYVIQWLEAVYEKRPDAPIPFYQLAQAYKKKAKYEKAIWAYQIAAEQGPSAAQAKYELASWLAEDSFVQDLPRALALFTQLAREGDAKVQSRVGSMYEHGKGCRANLEQAAYWYEQAANQGYPPAICYLAQCYYAGRGVKQDYAKALQLIEPQVQNSFPKACFIKGMWYEEGKAAQWNLEQAALLYQKADTYDCAQQALDRFNRIVRTADEQEEKALMEEEISFSSLHKEQADALYERAMALEDEGLGSEKTRLLIEAAELGSGAACGLLLKLFFMQHIGEDGSFSVTASFDGTERSVRLGDCVRWTCRARLLNAPHDVLASFAFLGSLEDMLEKNRKSGHVSEALKKDAGVFRKYLDMYGFLYGGMAAIEEKDKHLAYYYLKRACESSRSTDAIRKKAQGMLESIKWM